MNDNDLNFGDVLNDAFTGAAAPWRGDPEVAYVQIPAPVFRPMTPEEVAWHEEQLRQYDLWCFREAAAGCARWVATNCKLPFAHVWDEMTHMPESLLAMVDSPAGWSVIAAAVTRSYRDTEEIPPFPSIH